MWNFFVEMKNIKNLNKKLNKKKCLYLAFIASILFGLSTLIFTTPAGMPLVTPGIATGIFILSLIAIYFKSFILSRVMCILTDKKGIENALIPVVYVAYLFSIGLVVSGILNYIPAFGPFLGWLVLVFAGMIGYSLFFRLLVDNYKTDMLTVLLGLGIALLSIFAATSLILFSRIDLILGSLF